MCTIISSITTLYQIFSSEKNTSLAKLKLSKDAKVEKSKKESDHTEEPHWKPWDLIWPKENNKLNNLPTLNPIGKYAIKLFWMVSAVTS